MLTAKTEKLLAKVTNINATKKIFFNFKFILSIFFPPSYFFIALTQSLLLGLLSIQVIHVI